MLDNVLNSPLVLPFFQALLMIVFFGGAWSTLRERETFEGVVNNYRVLPSFAVRPVSYSVPIAELIMALGLIPVVTRPYAAIGVVFLLAVFNVAIAVNLMRGRYEIDCGCFSSVLRQHLSKGLVARNGVLMLMGGALWFAWSSPVIAGTSSIAWFDWFAGTVVALAVALIYLISVTLSEVQQHTQARRRRQNREDVKHA